MIFRINMFFSTENMLIVKRKIELFITNRMFSCSMHFSSSSYVKFMSSSTIGGNPSNIDVLDVDWPIIFQIFFKRVACLLNLISKTFDYLTAVTVKQETNKQLSQHKRAWCTLIQPKRDLTETKYITKSKSPWLCIIILSKKINT